MTIFFWLSGHSMAWISFLKEEYIFVKYSTESSYYSNFIADKPILLKHFDLVINDVVYIEHNLEALRSAESLKIKVFHYDKDLKDINKLNQFLKINISN